MGVKIICLQAKKRIILWLNDKEFRTVKAKKEMLFFKLIK